MELTHDETRANNRRREGSPGCSDPLLLAHVFPMSASRVSNPWESGTPSSRMQQTCSNGSRNGEWYHSCRTFRGKQHHPQTRPPSAIQQREGLVATPNFFRAFLALDGLSRGRVEDARQKVVPGRPPEKLGRCLRCVVFDHCQLSGGCS